MCRIDLRRSPLVPAGLVGLTPAESLQRAVRVGGRAVLVGRTPSPPSWPGQGGDEEGGEEEDDEQGPHRKQVRC